MTNPVSRRRVLGVAGTAAGSFAVSGILSGKGVAKPGEFCDFVWPITGKIIDTADSPGGITAGIKIKNATGTPVHASRAGEVTYAARIPVNPNGPGRTYSIEIGHENGYTTSYLTHATTATVEEGDRVKRGQQIGRIADVGVAVPHLYFSIDRQGNRSIPGKKNQHVSAGEMIRKDYPGIKCPNTEPGPGPIFDDLKKDKIALAERIERISGGTIQEKDQVQTVLGNLETAATNGTISVQEAANAVRRLKLGEEMTERALVGAGPATPNDGSTDYNIATQIAEAYVLAIIEMGAVLIPFGKIIQKIPVLRDKVNDFMIGISLYVKKVIRFLFSVGRRVKTRTEIGAKINSIVRTVDTVIHQVIDEVLGGESKMAISNSLKKRAAQIPGLPALLLNLILEPGLDAALTDLTNAANPSTGASFTGTLEGAVRAKEQGITDANETFQTARSGFEELDAALNSTLVKVVDHIFVAVEAIGVITGGSVSAIATGGEIAFGLGKAIARLEEAKEGRDTLTSLEKNHEQTLNGIINGTP